MRISCEKCEVLCNSLPRHVCPWFWISFHKNQLHALRLRGFARTFVHRRDVQHHPCLCDSKTVSAICGRITKKACPPPQSAGFYFSSKSSAQIFGRKKAQSFF